MSMVVQDVIDLLKKGDSLIMATVVGPAKGNRRTGARMLVRADGLAVGSIGVIGVVSWPKPRLKSRRVSSRSLFLSGRARQTQRTGRIIRRPTHMLYAVMTIVKTCLYVQ